MVGKVVVSTVSGVENTVFDCAYRLIKREIEKRSTARIGTEGRGGAKITLEICEGIGKEGYSISADQRGRIRITGNDEPGLLYGVGKFLRSSEFRRKGFVPSTWSGTSVPEKAIRGIYFATHFHNFYHDAPMEKVKQYIEEMVLWGVNTLCVWFDMHHYKSMRQFEALEMISRIREILAHARSMYLKTCLLFIGNEGFDESPVELRAQFTADHDGYTRQLAGHYHVELCPSRPEGLDLLLRWRKEVFQNFLDIKLDYIWIWPYDQGGCTCSECKPWGANGYLKIAEPVAELAKEMFPGVKIVLSTWLFDNFTAGEWDGLAEAFRDKPSWVDYLLGEFLEGQLPETVEKNGFPGGLPCLGFPEVSMYGATPWGGFGANPIPEHILSLWDTAGKYLFGGFPYSEGIFDDINKFIYTRLYWGDADNMQEILREYVRYEFGEQYTDEMLRLIELLETSLVRNRLDEDGINHNNPDSKIPWKGEQRFVIENPKPVEEAYEIAARLNAGLPVRVRKSWRWRILYLRSLIDKELLHNDFRTNKKIQQAYEALTEIYHAQNADYFVAPPTLQSILENRGGFSWT